MAKPATAISTPGRATLPWSRRPPVKRKKWHRSPSPNIELRERLEYAEPHMTALRLSLAFLSISLILPAQQWERDEDRSEEHTAELQSLRHLVGRLLLDKKKSPALRRGFFGLGAGRLGNHTPSLSR